jgi:hypothetical protein
VQRRRRSAQAALQSAHLVANAGQVADQRKVLLVSVASALKEMQEKGGA